MAVRATRETIITWDGDATGVNTLSALPNAASPGSIEIKALASGANTITVPLSTGVLVTSVTIVPPVGNAETLTLKGVTGDTGIALHVTDPTTIAIAPGVTTFVLTAGAIIQGVRLFWS